MELNPGPNCTANKRAKNLNVMPPWLAGPLPSIKEEAIRLYSTSPDVLEALTVPYIQTVLEALGVRRAHFVAMPVFLPRQRAPQRAAVRTPRSLVCAGVKVLGQEQGSEDGAAAV